MVRERTGDDLADCVAVLECVYCADRYPAVWPMDPSDWITPGEVSCAWVAHDASGIVGHVVLTAVDAHDVRFAIARNRRPPRPLLEIKRLFVDPAARGTGASTMLLDTAAREATRREARPVLETVASEPAPIARYERSGWRRIGSAVALWTMATGERPVMLEFELPV